VEKSQYELCIEVLRRLDRAGILKHVVLVGSWCTLLYKDYFASGTYRPALRTRDIDLLIPKPWAVKSKSDVSELLRDLGFVVGFSGAQGYIRLEHPQLIVEFLVPERGRPYNKPYPLPSLGVNAQALRFLDFLAEDAITSKLEEVTITLPHPVRFALHKLLVLNRRPTPAKQAKDREAAISILTKLRNEGRQNSVQSVFRALPRRWQTAIEKQLRESLDGEVIEVLRGT